MKKIDRRSLGWGMALLAAFGLWTALVLWVDVQPIGPENSQVGLAHLNGWFHGLTGVHMWLYTLTDWLSLLPLAAVMGFGLLGASQWWRRKDIRRVDPSLLVLGGFYLVVLAVFGLFEVVEINARPVLIQGVLETSYPSSTTMLALCVMPSVMLQLHARMKAGIGKTCVQVLLAAFTAFMVICRLVSGVHWLTDIIGGALLSAGLVLLYLAALRFSEK